MTAGTTIRRLDGPMDDRAELAAAIRRLIRAAVRTDAPGVVVPELTAAADRLEAAAGAERPETDRHMAFDAVVGPYNPLAPPIEVEYSAPVTYGRVRFTEAYEGPPGCVQGGVLASAFDIVLSMATFTVDAAGPTVSLTLRYRKPTLLHEECVFEAEVDRLERARSHARGRLVQRGVVTVEAEATFARIGRDKTLRLGERAGRGGSVAGDGRTDPAG